MKLFSCLKTLLFTLLWPSRAWTHRILKDGLETHPARHALSPPTCRGWGHVAGHWLACETLFLCISQGICIVSALLWDIPLAFFLTTPTDGIPGMPVAFREYCTMGNPQGHLFFRLLSWNAWGGGRTRFFFVAVQFLSLTFYHLYVVCSKFSVNSSCSWIYKSLSFVICFIFSLFCLFETGCHCVAHSRLTLSL